MNQVQEKVEIKNHGFVEPQIVEDREYLLGANSTLPTVVLMPGGHGWSEYFPGPERQRKNGLETMNCSNYGTLEALEAMCKFFQFPITDNFSERYTGVLTGTTRNGNDPHQVIETIRTTAGLIPESELPFDETIDTWEKYYSPNPMTKKYRDQGTRFLQQYEIQHEWVFKPTDSLEVKMAKLIAAMQYGPVAVSVLAWKERNGMYFKNIGETDNHWVVLKDFEIGVYWLVRDTYDGFEKKLEWGYDFRFAKRYHISKIAGAPVEQECKTWPQLFSEWLEEILNKILPAK